MTPKPSHDTNPNAVTVHLANVELHLGRPAGDEDTDHFLMTFHDPARRILVTVGFDEATLHGLGQSIVEHTSPVARPPRKKLEVVNGPLRL